VVGSGDFGHVDVRMMVIGSSYCMSMKTEQTREGQPE